MDEFNVQRDEAEVLVGERLRLVGLHDTEIPEDGLTIVDIDKVPENPEVPVAVAVVDPDEPLLRLTTDGLAVIPKSGD